MQPPFLLVSAECEALSVRTTASRLRSRTEIGARSKSQKKNKATFPDGVGGGDSHSRLRRRRLGAATLAAPLISVSERRLRVIRGLCVRFLPPTPHKTTPPHTKQVTQFSRNRFWLRLVSTWEHEPHQSKKNSSTPSKKKKHHLTPTNPHHWAFKCFRPVGRDDQKGLQNKSNSTTNKKKLAGSFLQNNRLGLIQHGRRRRGVRRRMRPGEFVVDVVCLHPSVVRVIADLKSKRCNSKPKTKTRDRPKNKKTKKKTERKKTNAPSQRYANVSVPLFKSATSRVPFFFHRLRVGFRCVE